MNLLPHIAGRVFATPLMISRAKLDVIVGIIAPRLQGKSLPPAAPAAARGYDVETGGIAVKADNKNKRCNKQNFHFLALKLLTAVDGRDCKSCTRKDKGESDP